MTNFANTDNICLPIPAMKIKRRLMPGMKSGQRSTWGRYRWLVKRQPNYLPVVLEDINGANTAVSG